jgi:SAM-dependent methyltransferase
VGALQRGESLRGDKMGLITVLGKHKLEVIRKDPWQHEFYSTYRSDAEVFFPNLMALLKGRKVLEIGCNSGGFVKLLRSKGVDAYGVDLYRIPEPPIFISKDYMDLPVKVKYDAIFAFGVFEEDAIYRPFAWGGTEGYDQVRRRKFETFAAKAGAKNPKHPKTGPFERLIPSPECQAFMVRKLHSLLNPSGFCVLCTYTSALIFAKDVVEANGFHTERFTRKLYEPNCWWERNGRKKRHVAEQKTMYVLVSESVNS